MTMQHLLRNPTDKFRVSDSNMVIDITYTIAAVKLGTKPFIRVSAAMPTFEVDIRAIQWRVPKELTRNLFANKCSGYFYYCILHYYYYYYIIGVVVVVVVVKSSVTTARTSNLHILLAQLLLMFF
jgi:hypothetical protein